MSGTAGDDRQPKKNEEKVDAGPSNEGKTFFYFTRKKKLIKIIFVKSSALSEFELASDYPLGDHLRTKLGSP